MTVRIAYKWLALCLPRCLRVSRTVPSVPFCDCECYRQYHINLASSFLNTMPWPRRYTERGNTLHHRYSALSKSTSGNLQRYAICPCASTSQPLFNPDSDMVMPTLNFCEWAAFTQNRMSRSAHTITGEITLSTPQ